MTNLQKGFFRLTIVVSVVAGLHGITLNHQDSFDKALSSYRMTAYEKWKSGEIYYENNNGIKLTYKDDLGYTYRDIPLPEGFEMAGVASASYLFCLLRTIPHVLVVWVIYFTIRFVVIGFIGKNDI